MKRILPLVLALTCSCISHDVHATQPPADGVPTPESVLGFPVGADFQLADWEAIQGYFRELDRASDRVTVREIGKTAMDRDMILVFVSSEANLARLDEIREGVRRLADPRTTTDDETSRLVASLPAVVFVGCAQHASEVGSTQMSLELAWRLAAEETPEMQAIRDEVLLLLVPSLNPDGHQLVCDWYREHVGTPFEGSWMPWLYQKYVGHDINRDWAMITQAETRNVSRILYEEWFPQILVDVHQMGRSGARMFIPPYYDPVNPNMDPLIQYRLSLVGAQMQLDLSEGGYKGVLTNAMFDEWLLGYLTSVPTRHNIVAQLIEMASANVASPIFQRRRELRGTKGLDEYAPRANFPEPWEGGWWRLRDIVEYEETALLSVLGLAARSRESVLLDFHRLGTKQVEAGRTEPPFAFLVPADQRDPVTAWRLLTVLRRGGVEVHEARKPFEADGITYPAGTWVVPMAQPYRAHAKDLLERQVYPNLRTYPGGPPDRPYDVTGWTLPLLMGVKTVEVVNPFEAELAKISRDEDLPPGLVRKLEANPRYLLVERSQNQAYVLANRELAAGTRVRSLGRETTVAERRFSSGTFVIDVEEGTLEGLTESAQALGLRAFLVASLPEEVALVNLRPVRLGLYQPWTASMDEGWTRWVLEEFEFPYRTVHDAEVRAGGLHERYDAIVLCDISPESILRGVREGDLPKKYTGGIGEEGLFALRDFVREGGTLIGLDASCGLLIDALELPVREVTRPSGEDEEERDEEGGKGREKTFFCPGSILRIHADTDHPLAWGLESSPAVMFSNSPVFEPMEEKKEEKNGPTALAQEAEPVVEFVGTYPRVNPLLSGWIENDEVIRGKGALVQVGFDRGVAILIGFRCQFRAQSHGTYRVLFNAILSAGR